MFVNGVNHIIYFWNVTKTKEVIFDFRHSVVNHLPLTIDNSPVDICDSFKYLGVTFDNKLNWSDHAALIVSKCKQRLFFLRLLNSFNINSQILHLFYTSMIESVISYNITLWWCSMSSADKKSISRIHKQAHKIVKLDITSIDEIYTRNVTKKVKTPLFQCMFILSNVSMILWDRVPDSVLFHVGTQRYRKSFVPNSIHVYNMSV